MRHVERVAYLNKNWFHFSKINASTDDAPSLSKRGIVHFLSAANVHRVKNEKTNGHKLDNKPLSPSKIGCRFLVVGEQIIG